MTAGQVCSETRRRNLDTSEFYANVGKTLRGFRHVEGLTTRALAERVGVSTRTIERIETAKMRCPLHTLLAIANELDLSLDFDVFPVAKDERKTA